MKPSYWILSAISFLLIFSFGVLSALNGAQSSKLPWQGTLNAAYDPIHNVGASSVANNARFTLTGSNTVVMDSVTGLQWQSYYVSLSATIYTWGNAKAYCASLNLGGYPVGSWRLPAVKELASIADSSVTTYINTNYFQAQNANYWTSTPLATDNTQAFVVGPGGNVAGYDLKTNSTSYYARCVHN